MGLKSAPVEWITGDSLVREEVFVRCLHEYIGLNFLSSGFQIFFGVLVVGEWRSAVAV